MTYPIRIDAKSIAPAFVKYLTDALGFCRSDFDAALDGVVTHTAAHHLTLMPNSANAFTDAFDKVVHYLTLAKDSMVGYVEGEFPPLDEKMSFRPFDSRIELPFKLYMGLLPDLCEFCESEVHVTLARDKSDPRLIESLAAMGFYPAWIQ